MPDSAPVSDQHLGSPGAWIIEPRQTGLRWRLREIWHYRYLFSFFAVQTVAQMFKGTVLQPVWMTMRLTGSIGLTSLIFGSVLDVPSEGLPYFLFFLAGMAPWTLFETGLMFVTRSVERNRGLLTKIYFPRIILPASGLSPALLELGVVIVALIGTLLYHLRADGRWYARSDLGLLAAVGALAVSLLFALAVGLFTSVLQVRFRDTRYSLRYGMRFWFYFTPIIYPISQVPEKWRWVVYCNPMAWVVETFKWGLLGIGHVNPAGVAFGLSLVLIIFTTGFWFFTRAESGAIDKL